MGFVFSWLQLTVMCYLASAVLSPYSLFGSAILPWWSWGILITLNYFHNDVHFKRRSGGLTFAISNLVFFLAFGVGGLGYLQQSLSGRFWPNSFMNIVVSFVVVVSLSYSFYNPPTEKLRTQLWEIGILVSSYGAFLASHYLNIPYAFVVPLVVIAVGLFRQAFSPREESMGVIRSSRGSNRFSIGIILLLLMFATTVLSLIGLASNRSLGQALNSFFTRIITFYNQFGRETLNKPTKFTPFMRDNAELMASTSSYGTTAPLWFMILLWIILGFTIILLIIYGVIRLIEFIQFLKLTKLDPGTRKASEGLDLVTTLRKFVENIPFWVAIIVRKAKHAAYLLAFQIGISPKEIKGLYSYFLWWCGFIGIKRKSNQTLREYQEMLRQAIPELNSELVAGIERLTISYERYSYGGDPVPLSVEEVKEVYKTLAKYRRIFKPAIPITFSNKADPYKGSF